MAVAELLLRAVERWGLRSVSQAWVDTAWELDFTETEPLDSRLEGVITDDGLDAFSQLYKALYLFAAEDHKTTESAWTLFVENNISHNALVAVLYHFVQEAQSKKADVNQRLFALHAAGLYFLLVEIPGSIANRVFHQVMFEKCLQTLSKCWPQESDLPRKRKKDHSKSSKGDRQKRGRSSRKENTPMDEIFEEEEDQEEEIYFSAHELLQIRESLFFLLKNLLRLLSKFSLKERPQCVQTCIQIFVTLMSFEPCPHGFEPSEKMTIDQAKYVPELAYFGLQLLCSPLHSLEDKVLCLVFHRLLNVILMCARRDISSGTSAIILSQVTGARNLAVKFISSLTEEMKEVAFPVLRILLQHICVKVPDKSEYRTYAALSVAQLLYKLPCAEHADFIAWLYQYSHNNKISYRVFALDVALALLDLPERVQDISLSEEQQMFLKHKFLVQDMVFGRCSDKAPTVRSKALSSFAQCLEAKATLNIENIQELLQGTAGSTGQDSNMPAGTSVANTEGPSSHRQKTFPTFKTIEVTERDTTLFDGKEIMTILRLRAGDEKTNVRKSALQVLMSILKHHVISCTPEDLATLQDRCRDPAVSVRKQALQSITDLLMSQPENVLIQKAWLTGVVPVIMDCENSVQERALDCLDRLLLQPIKHCNKFTHQDRSQVLAWDLLTLFTKESQELSRYLNKAFHIWSKRGKFSSPFVNSIISHTETERATPAWMLLAKVASSSSKLDYSKIVEVWDSIRRERDASSETTVYILCVIGSIAKHLPNSIRGRLMDDFKCWLQDFQCPLEAISPAVETIQKLCYASTDAPKEAQDMLNKICGDLLTTCEHCISSIVLQEYRAEQEDVLVRHLFILGEAAQLCPAKVEKRIFLLIQSILASPDSLDQVSSPVDNEDLPPSQPLSQFRGSVMPSVVRAHAFITLGKLCLQHEDLAKKCIAALARELEVSKDLAVRNNVVIVMCDLCICYTTMADRYIPNVSICLKDPEPFIRKQTLILLTNLLQEEFVKWKGSLFFRFVIVLVDPNQEIASLAKFCLVHLLLKRNPAMFSQHFIECIFHFNNYERHEKYNRFSQSEREKAVFSLKGKANKEKRMEIYKFLLDHFTDEQRFNITSKISLNILACFVDGILPLDMEASDLLSDTFEILSCKEIKLSAMRSRPEDDLQPDEDELAMANAVLQVAQKKLISQVQKKNFIENVIPIITSLKTSLEQSRLPAVRDLMNYLREVMQDYRNEIKEVFAMDKQLAAELEYDMKKYEEQLERESEQGQELPVEAEALHALAVVQSPTMERAALPGDQDQAASPAARRDFTSPLRSPPPLAPIGFTTPRADILKPRPRNRSLNTLAILNSAKKATEAADKQRSKSMGGRLTFPGSKQSSKVSFCSLNQPSSGANVFLEGRAVSTPEKSINNVTFGAGVSCISLTHTPTSAGEKRGAQDPQRAEIVCLASPDKPLPQPQQWKINFPARGKSPSSIGLRRSNRKTLQKLSQ
ncbi:condensin-2 complex subunit D3 [Rhineura floridana]|uniref:condensin-2 complex subunit D3 n=1 Tax=Rhineura floridana TaxID=261503 RepID=UPI002AC82DDC|nr:condensin-2 complex subunit D3 [Rhineura floridana]